MLRYLLLPAIFQVDILLKQTPFGVCIASVHFRVDISCSYTITKTIFKFTSTYMCNRVIYSVSDIFNLPVMNSLPETLTLFVDGNTVFSSTVLHSLESTEIHKVGFNLRCKMNRFFQFAVGTFSVLVFIQKGM